MAEPRILLVEDESIVAFDVQRTLEALGYRVCGMVCRGDESIQVAAQTQPDLVLMDIKLKGEIDGIEAAERITASFDIPVVYLTAYADEQSLQRAKVTAPFGYILKPFEERDLRAAIEMALYRHQMERTLKEREQWLSTTLGSIGDGVVTTSEKGSVTSVNPAAEALTSWKNGDASGKQVTEVLQVLDEQEHSIVQPAVTEALQHGVVVRVTDKVLISRDGRRVPIDYSIAPIKDNKGKVSGLVFALRDMTERKQVEEQRLRLEAEMSLAQKMEALGLLAGGVAHDFNNMLTVILGSVQLGLRQGDPRSPLYAELASIEAACKQAATLVRQLLAFSRRQELEPRVLDLNQLISDSTNMLGHIVGENVELRISLAPRLKTVLADGDSLVRIVMNLAANARDAMPHGGVLTIKTGLARLNGSGCRGHPNAKSGEYVQLSISDTGVGMDKVTRAHLFEPFFTTKEAGKGTGLGLAVVYGIVKQHNGWIEVESQAGQGTKCSVYLPTHSAPAEQSAVPTSEAAPRRTEPVFTAKMERVGLAVP